MRKIITTTSFLSILVAWSVSVVATGLYQAWTIGKTDDFGVIVFWSALFELLAWLIFTKPVLTRLNHSKWYFSIYIFPFLTLLYAELVFFILIGWLFLKSEFYVVFFSAGVVGFSFGLTYSLLINSDRIKKAFESSELLRYSVILYPITFSILFFWAFPQAFPSTAFRVMPDEIQRQIVAKTITRFKVCDDFELLNQALPGYFRIKDGFGTSGASYGNFRYSMTVKNNRIIYLETSDQPGPVTSNSNIEDPCL
ncbi:hypothetical protein [Ekhidna sp. To15]|uniref:hypothetical protein n=1 Tax=Ekhidna sp. To15 TaxID=3395267 RepID=UPI003F5235FE